MDMQGFLEIVHTRRCVRRFKTDPVPDEWIEQILEAGRWAMSGGNAQPWEFVIAKSQETRNKIFDVYHQHELHGHHMEMTRNPEFRHPIRANPPEDKPTFRDAPVIIVIVGDQRTMASSVTVAALYTDSHVFHMNMGNVTQMICLAAAARGLAAQWVSTSEMIEEPLKRALGVPDIYKIYSMVPLGYPNHRITSFRRPLGEITHREHYEMAKYRSDEQVISDIMKMPRGSPPPRVSG
ncbi:MAG: nitroreductase family protein [Chloroflexi bacterium]|nr:nitroreductase family protein [Chloroflexota bacterium]